MRLSDYKGKDALRVLADILEPASNILSDKDVRSAQKENGLASAVAIAIKNHEDDVIAILARLDNEEPETYLDKISFMTLPKRAYELVTDKDLLEFFRSQSQITEETSSGSATETTGASVA